MDRISRSGKMMWVPYSPLNLIVDSSDNDLTYAHKIHNNRFLGSNFQDVFEQNDNNR